MDSQNKDESRARLREEALARRMGEALDRISVTGARECPDAALIAAYYERALQPEELEQWEGHFAGCSRCRKILAVLAASIDAPLAETEVARLGELVAVARPASGVPPVRPSKVIKSNRFDWRTRWLAPALGVAAVLSVWFALRAPWRASVQGPSDTLITQAPKVEPPLAQGRNASGLDQASGVESKKEPESSAAAPQDRLSGRKAPAGAGLQSQETNPGADNKDLSRLKAKTSATEARLDNEKRIRRQHPTAPSGPLRQPPRRFLQRLQPRKPRLQEAKRLLPRRLRKRRPIYRHATNKQRGESQRPTRSRRPGPLRTCR